MVESPAGSGQGKFSFHFAKGNRPVPLLGSQAGENHSKVAPVVLGAHMAVRGAGGRLRVGGGGGNATLGQAA